jgi:hypothetical protein
MNSPANIRIENRQKKNKGFWASPEWKKAAKAYKAGKVCEWCGASERLVVCHPSDIYPGHPDYMDFLKSQCKVLCQKCNRAEMGNLVLCQQCKRGYHTRMNEKCLNCDEERAKKIKERIERSREFIRKHQDEQNALRRRIYKERKERLK